MIPDYLLSEQQCEMPTWRRGEILFCIGNHADAIKQNPATGRWFITMGHAGFNLPANNREGYESRYRAYRAMKRCGGQS